MNSRIDVIIPVYNAEKSIERCVESIIFGELRDVDVILVDDCSIDNSWKCCQELERKYANVHCYQNEENRGVSFTRNQGLLKAGSEYVLFVDSDDWVSGKYAAKLLDAAEKYADALIICGLHFREEIAGYSRDYIWQENGEMFYHIGKKDFFDLPERFHLQQLWNKIFHRDIIERYHIRFDIAQNMGEDFQFVLDYMEAAQVEKCVILNEPLYYYIRANGTSLMSNFGLIENQYEYERLKQLFQLCGKPTDELRKRYKQALIDLKENYVYQAMHSSKAKKDKVSFIESVMQDGRAKYHYRSQQRLLIKEKLAEKLKKINQFPRRVQEHIERKRRDRLAVSMKKKLKIRDFTIISQNCIGGVFYHDMGLQFTTPTINLFFSAADFVRFVLNLDYYLSCEMHMVWGEEYPIGYLDDIAIYFMHYYSCREAREMWEKRKRRINKEKMIIFCTDMESFTDEVYEQWKLIPYTKVLFTATKRAEAGTIYFQKYEKNGEVPDLIPKREFYKDGTLINYMNELD